MDKEKKDEYAEVVDRLENHFAKALANLRELVKSDVFAMLSEKEKLMLFMTRLQTAFDLPDDLTENKNGE